MNDSLSNNSLANVLGASPQDLDLAMILDAWQMATDRLQKTHETLRDEVRRLTDELEVKNRELARQNRLADLGQMAAHVAHEVRNSLAPVTLYLSLLRRNIASDPLSADLLKKIDSCFQALEVTVTDLLQFTADRTPARQEMDMRRFVNELFDVLAPQFEAQRIQPKLEIAAGTMLSADPNMLRRALLNLILNAVDAMPTGGELVITALHNQHGFEVQVADSGPGIPEELRERMFEPFFTTKSEGTGLGLAIVQRIADAHDGSLSVSNRPEGGAAFMLTFPLRRKEAAA
jgi:signal transduction histidine kinase